MGEDLKRANKLFEEFYEQVKKQKAPKDIKHLLYIFYLKGFSDASGMSQVIA